MKKINCIALVIFLVFFSANFACAEGQVSRWKYYVTDGGYDDHYYDTKSIVHTQTGIVRVWEKKVATEKSNEVMKEMKELSELKEVNCPMREYRSNENYYFGNENRWKTKPTDWEVIGPETWMEALHSIVCKKKEKNSPW